MRSHMKPTGEASPYGFLRFGFAVVAFAALTLCGSLTFADDEPAEASKPEASDAAAPSTPCSAAGQHPQDDPKVCAVERNHSHEDVC
jgi:hypothetical protein